MKQSINKLLFRNIYSRRQHHERCLPVHCTSHKTFLSIIRKLIMDLKVYM